jgi:hypothetical protein
MTFSSWEWSSPNHDPEITGQYSLSVLTLTHITYFGFFYMIFEPVLLRFQFAPDAGTLLVPQARHPSRTTNEKYMARPV